MIDKRKLTYVLLIVIEKLDQVMPTLSSTPAISGLLR
jgi:hypothetical protein